VAIQAQDSLVRLVAGEPLPIPPDPIDLPGLSRTPLTNEELQGALSSYDHWVRSLYSYLRRLATKFTRANIVAAAGGQGVPDVPTELRDYYLVYDQVNDTIAWSPSSASFLFSSATTSQVNVGTLGTLGRNVTAVNKGLTVEFWCKTTESPGDFGIAGWKNTSHPQEGQVFVTLNNSDLLQMSTSWNANNYTVTTDAAVTIRNGIWHHVVLHLEIPSTGAIHVDGASVASTVTTSASSGTDAWTDFPTNWYWGEFNDGVGNEAWIGELDECVLYDIVLPTVRIQDHYEARRTGSWGYLKEILRDNPVGYWKFDEVEGTSAKDETANNQDGTIGVATVLGQPGAV
jgi:hypothetical protein